MCVTGTLLHLRATGSVTPELQIQPINQSVLFLKEREVFFTNDAWRVVLDLNTSSYTEVILIIPEDLWLTCEQRKEFKTVSELKQIYTLLNNLDSKIGYFHQVLPRLDSRRDLLDLGSKVLKYLFDVATIADLHHLHLTLDELKSKDADIVHSLANQIIYMRTLDHTARVNANAIANLSSIVKYIIIRSHDRFVVMT